MQTGGGWARDDDALVAAFAAFAHDERRRSPLYAALAETVAGEAELQALFDQTPAEQRRPVLLLAALHHLARRHPDEPLAQALPTVSGRVDVEGAVRAVRGFCRSHESELQHLLATKRTQTNEVGRSGPLSAGLAAIGQAGTQRVSLIELGASAGLLLLLDRYRIEIGAAPPVGPQASPVVVRCDVRGTPPPSAPFEIGARVGVDLEPVDVLDPEAASWLLSCIWADDLERFERVKAAVELARTDPPVVLPGDAADALPELLERVAPDEHPVVFNCWALTYMTTERRGAILRTLTDVASRRDLTWLSMESTAETPDLPRPTSPMRSPRATDLVAWIARGGVISVRRLAELHPHGRWIDWHDGASIGPDVGGISAGR